MSFFDVLARGFTFWLAVPWSNGLGFATGMLSLTTHAALESIPDSVSLQCSFIHRIMIARYLTLVFLDGSCSPSRTTLEIDYHPHGVTWNHGVQAHYT